uniref:Uncharacterized protein n=1 Tax=Noctiluca scintillans TaxID=2966 RepID=A0A6T8SH78_NOCSC|mmetsp:Transcript_14364/g.39163  ORF Transcript_14364/g.39163 Transcript_14364/m.39163 type:complete len:971 (+) Transcript_14364:66-2978(+)
MHTLSPALRTGSWTGSAPGSLRLDDRSCSRSRLSSADIPQAPKQAQNDSTRIAEEARELRRVLDSTGFSELDFRQRLEVEARHQHSAIEADRDLRMKEFAETHSVLEVTRSRLSTLEGTAEMHSNQLKGMGSVAEQLQLQQERLDSLERSLMFSDKERNHRLELVQLRLTDELSISATALEVKAQEIMHMTKYAMEQMEVRLRDEFRGVSHHTGGLQEVHQSIEGLEHRFREAHAEHVANHHDIRNSLSSTIEAQVREMMCDHSVDFDTKHRDLGQRLQAGVDAVESKMLDEVHRVSREGDLKLEKVHASLRSHVDGSGAKLLDELSRLSREQESKQREYPIHVKCSLETLQSNVMKELDHAQINFDVKMETMGKALEAKLRDEIGEAGNVSNEKHTEHKHAVEALRDGLTEEITRLSKDLENKHDSIAQVYDARCRDITSEIHASRSTLESLLAEELSRLSSEKHTQAEAVEVLNAKVNDVDAKYEKDCVLLSADLRSVEGKLRDEIAAHIQNSAAQKKDIDDSISQQIDVLAVKIQHDLSSSLTECGYETLEERVMDRLGDQDARIEKQRLHQMGYLEGMSVTLRQEHAAEVACQQDTKHEETLEKCRAAVEQFAASLRDEFFHNRQDQVEKLAEARKDFASTVQELETNLRSDLSRLSTETHSEILSNHNRVQHVLSVMDSLETNFRDVSEAAVTTGIAPLREELARQAEKCNGETEKLSAAIDGMNTRHSEAVSRLSRDNDMKFAEQHSAVQSLDALLLSLRHEQSRMSNAVDSQHAEFREVHLSGLAQLREDLERAVSHLQVKHEQVLIHSTNNMEATDRKMQRVHDMGVEISHLRDEVLRTSNDVMGKHEQALDHTTASIEALDRKISDEIRQRILEGSADREERNREFADLCAAVQSVRSHLSQTPRNTSPTRRPSQSKSILTASTSSFSRPSPHDLSTTFSSRTSSLILGNPSLSKLYGLGS